MDNWKILVVDDSEQNLDIIADFLEDGPYTLKMAMNGAQALPMLESGNYDLLILDRMMPVMDGMALLQRMQADERFQGIPVIMQTAAASPEQIREGINAGCYYYLTKPYKLDALVGIVNSALSDLREERLRRDTLTHSPHIPITDTAQYSFNTIEEARRLAILLAMQCPDTNMVAMGLTELLLNAVEHGNLGITYAEKTRLKLDEQWEAEIVRRLMLPENHAKKATINFTRHPHEIIFTITDQGQGFDWGKYLEFDPERAFDPNGRGITMAKNLSFHTLDYRGNGNQVIATVFLPT